MDKRYRIEDTREIITPALIVFREIVEENVAEMIRIAGSPGRLRPHCKTHKMREAIEMQLAQGVTKQKCATLAEAEMVARAGVRDIFLAYNLVGPNIARAVKFLETWPDVRLAVTADHPAPLAQLGRATSAAGREIDVLLDLDIGMHRTGVAPGPEAHALYERIAETGGVRPGGLHVYDGHNQQTPPAERAAAVQACWSAAASLRDALVSAGLPVPRMVAGGTGSFPVFAKIDDPILELSPGTCVLHDVGYAEKFPELNFRPAAVLLSRVISRPTANRVTLDLGYKACASDPPAGSRLRFPDLPDAREVLHNEEHLVLETSLGADLAPGDELIAIPRHICPTSALHRYAHVVAGGKLVGRWEVAARDRMITV